MRRRKNPVANAFCIYLLRKFAEMQVLFNKITILGEKSYLFKILTKKIHKKHDFKFILTYFKFTIWYF